MSIKNSGLSMALLLVFAASCGGGFKYTIRDALIADVPIAEKQALLNVKDEQAQLKQLRDKAQSELNIAKRDLDVARAEYRIAKNGVDKVQADVNLANSTTDANRIDRAKLRLTVAHLARGTAETKVSWRDLRVAYAKQQLRVNSAEQRLAAARYEQEKARLASTKGKTPYQNFSVVQFDAQVSEAQAQLDKERVQDDTLRQQVVGLESRYQIQKQALDAAQSGAPPQAVPPAPPLSSKSELTPAP